MCVCVCDNTISYKIIFYTETYFKKAYIPDPVPSAPHSTTAVFCVGTVTYKGMKKEGIIRISI